MIKRSDLKFYCTYLLAQECQKRGFKVKKLLPKTKKSYLEVTGGGKTYYIIGQRIGSMDYAAYFFCKYKYLTKELLQKNQISVPKGELFGKGDLKEALAFAKKIGFPVVVKPNDGTWGRQVFANVRNQKELREAITNICETNAAFLIEEKALGAEYRFTATKKKLLGVINRIPANVVGDGVHSISWLIKEKNSDPKRGSGHEKTLVKIMIDNQVTAKLSDEGLKLKSVPEKGQQIFLRHTSNLSAGGDSVDCTDLAHPNYFKLAPRVIRAIPGLPYGGFDLITPDITKDPFKSPYTVIEVNDSPMFSMHQEPYIGKKRKIVGDIIDVFFPVTKK